MAFEVLSGDSREVRNLEERLQRGDSFVRGFRHYEKKSEPTTLVVIQRTEQYFPYLPFTMREKRYLFEFGNGVIDEKLMPEEFPENLVFSSFDKADRFYDVLSKKFKSGDISDDYYKKAVLATTEIIRNARNKFYAWKDETSQKKFDGYTLINLAFGVMGIGIVFFSAKPILHLAKKFIGMQSLNEDYLSLALILLGAGAGLYIGHILQKTEVLLEPKRQLRDSQFTREAYAEARKCVKN